MRRQTRPIPRRRLGRLAALLLGLLILPGQLAAAPRSKSARRSPLALQISTGVKRAKIGADLPITVTYLNTSKRPIRVLRLLALQCYPLGFEVHYREAPGRHLFVGPRKKYNISPDDWFTLAPGKRRRQKMNLLRDAKTGQRYFRLDRPGTIEVQASYCGFFGLPETRSNTLRIHLQR